MNEKNEAHSPASSSYLNWKNRPNYIKVGIDQYYGNIQGLEDGYSTNQSWKYDGKKFDQYYLCEIDEYLLLKHLILSQHELKSFNLLDVGS